MSKYFWNKVVLISFGLSIGSLAFADQSAPVKAYKTTTPPSIDGVVDGNEWKDVPFVEGLHDVNTGASYADGGKFWICYDKDFVYFAAQLTESERNRIRATEYRSNVSLSGDDFVELDLDLSGSLTAFNSFSINPQGATSINIAGGRAAKREWLGDFVAKARITETGWEAEAKIPWQAMSIPKGGKRDVRFNIQRFIAKNVRVLSYVFVPPTQTALTPTWAGVELPNPEVDRSIKLLPYMYAGYDPKSGGVFNGGLDMKTALTDQINMVGSINPDFRNIENSILSLDFSRFERIAGETRPFFREGSQYRQTQTFLSQRISQFDAGINTYGRLDPKTSFSMLGTTQFGHESDLVLNVTNDPNPNTSIRATITDLERPGFSNKTHMIRFIQNYGPFSFFVRNMGSQDTALGNGQQNDFNTTYSQNGFTSSVGWASSDKSFSPKLGYVQEVDYSGPNAFFGYTRNFDRGTISDFDLNIFGLSYDHMDGSYYRKEFGSSASLTFRPGLNFSFGSYSADFQGSKDRLYTYILTYPRGNPYNRIAVQFDEGIQAGQSYRSLSAVSAFRLNKKLQMTVREQHVDYMGAADQMIVSANWDLGNYRSLGGRFVRQNDKINAYLAYQRSGNEGMEYFLILGDPNALTYRNALTLKVVVPVTIGGRGSKIKTG